MLVLVDSVCCCKNSVNSDSDTAFKTLLLNEPDIFMKDLKNIMTASSELNLFLKIN